MLSHSVHGHSSFENTPCDNVSVSLPLPCQNELLGIRIAVYDTAWINSNTEFGPGFPVIWTWFVVCISLTVPGQINLFCQIWTSPWLGSENLCGLYIIIESLLLSLLAKIKWSISSLQPVLRFRMGPEVTDPWGRGLKVK